MMQLVSFCLLLSGRVLAATFIAISGFYCFAIGRDRYQATSEFVSNQSLWIGLLRELQGVFR